MFFFSIGKGQRMALKKWVLIVALIAALVNVLCLVLGFVLSADDGFSPPLFSPRAGFIILGLVCVPLVLLLFVAWYFVPWALVEFYWPLVRIFWRKSDRKDGATDEPSLSEEGGGPGDDEVMPGLEAPLNL